MKRAIAILGVFGLAALIAVYVALAPNAPWASPGAGRSALTVLDSAAAQLIAVRGRSAAVVALLALGVVLALLVAVATGRKGSAEPVEQAEPFPPPMPEPTPRLQERRLASLRRRAAADGGASGLFPKPLPRPVVLVRAVREREESWFGARSWLGGVPRLDGGSWPRDANGVPLPFAAQIDLADLAAACPESPLPREGSLAFFLGTGAVVAVPPGRHEFSDPPADLPPAFDEGGFPFPIRANRLSRLLFPFWPVEPVALDLPEHLRDPRDQRRVEAIEQAMRDLLSQLAEPRTSPFTATDPILWWHGVRHLADQIHVALESAGRLVALREDGLRRAETTLAEIEATGEASEDRLETAHRDAADQRAALASLQAQREGLPGMAAAIDGLVAGRDPWAQLTREEFGVVEEFLVELRASYGDLIRHHAPHALAELTTLSLRAMVSGTPDALAAMPDAQLARINREHRLALCHPHQMFGLGGRQRSARDEHRADLLLLQLGYDDLMEWRWGDLGLFQFWISPQALAAQDWGAAELSFDSA